MTKYVIDGGKNLFQAYDKDETDAKFGTVLTGTLTAGNTTLTISDASITTDSIFDFYTSVYGINPSAVSVSTGSIELTFDALSYDLGVRIRVL